MAARKKHYMDLKMDVFLRGDFIGKVTFLHPWGFSLKERKIRQEVERVYPSLTGEPYYIRFTP